MIRAKTFLDIAGRWLKRPEMTGIAIEFLSAAVELHAEDAALREMLGDFLLRKSEKAQAEENYRKAFALDANIGKGASLDEYVARKMNSVAEKKN